MLPSVTEIPVQATEYHETLTDRQVSMMAKHNSRLLVRAHGFTEELQPGKEFSIKQTMIRRAENKDQ